MSPHARVPASGLLSRERRPSFSFPFAGPLPLPALRLRRARIRLTMCAMKSPNGKSKPKDSRPLQRLSAFRPQKKNVNLGKPYGLAALDKSIRRDGYSAPMVAAADGEIFAGSKRLETSADVFGPDVRPIVVHSDGTRPIVHVRDDIPDADDPRAKRLGYADNTIAVMDWNPDGELLAALAAEDATIADLARQENASLKALAFVGNPDFQPVDIYGQPRLDQKKPVKCPQCGAEFSPE